MVPLAARWTAEMQQVSDDTPETAGWRFRLYNAADEELHHEEHGAEARELSHLIDVGAGNYALKAMRLDADGNEFGDEVASAAFEVKPGMVSRLVMTSLTLRIGDPAEMAVTMGPVPTNARDVSPGKGQRVKP